MRSLFSLFLFCCFISTSSYALDHSTTMELIENVTKEAFDSWADYEKDKSQRSDQELEEINRKAREARQEADQAEQRMKQKELERKQSQMATDGAVRFNGELKKFYPFVIPEDTGLGASICCATNLKLVENNVARDHGLAAVIRLSKNAVIYYRQKGNVLMRYTCDAESVGKCDVFAPMGSALQPLKSMNVKLSCSETEPRNDFLGGRNGAGYIDIGVDRGTVSVDNAPGQYSCNLAQAEQPAKSKKAKKSKQKDHSDAFADEVRPTDIKAIESIFGARTRAYCAIVPDLTECIGKNDSHCTLLRSLEPDCLKEQQEALTKLSGMKIWPGYWELCRDILIAHDEVTYWFLLRCLNRVGLK